MLVSRSVDLSPLGTSAVAGLKAVEFALEAFDGAVSGLEILVEPVALGDELERFVSHKQR